LHNSDEHSAIWQTDFAHIYVERAAYEYPLTSHILARFKRAAVIPIEHYKDVFARTGQSFAAQKQAPKLILAVQSAPFLYRGADVSHDFGHPYFYYTSSLLNCVYNCEYCFLQGMFPSANMVLYVNLEDSFAALDAMLADHPVYLSITYETDILAFEHVAPLTARWIEYAGTRAEAGLTVEVRTKSANYRSLAARPPAPNVILAWTLSPTEVIQQYEHRTPNLTARLRALADAVADGWRVRLCFDPILPIADWQEKYRACFERTFAALPAERIEDISIGTFRINKDYLKTMRKDRPDAPLLHEPFECRDGVYSYSARLTDQLLETVRTQLANYVPREKVISL
jgi:spore photoproduct lyase